jgi:hypothetical protein
MKNLINAKHLPHRIHIPVTGLFLLFLFLAPCLVKGQCAYQYEPDTSSPRIRNIIFTIPVARNSTINGLAIGFRPRAWRGAQTLNINGVAVAASPFDPILGVFVLLFSVDLEPKSSTYPKDDFSTGYLYPKADTVYNNEKFNKFNGLILGTITPVAVSNGVNISAVLNASHAMNGLSISGLFNHHHSFKGVLIAVLRNKTTTGKGIQIGLFNRCKEGKVVQIGLLNKIGKRTIPFINFQF